MAFIYVIQPDPAARPHRLKVGIGEVVAHRLQEARRWCPEATVVATWANKTLQHEQTLLWSLAAKYKRVGVEVFDVRDKGEAIAYIDGLLSMLPTKPAQQQPKQREYHLTWNSHRGGVWYKKRGRKQYSVTCSRLARDYAHLYKTNTKEGSYDAALAWWGQCA